MKKDILRKGWIVIVIFLLIGISIAPIVNANFNRILPTTKNNGEVEEGDFVEVTCQVSTLRGIRQVVKNIPQTEFDKITKLANEVNALLDGKCSVTKLREKVSALAFELKEVGLFPKGIDVDDATDLVMKYVLHSRQSFTVSNNQQIKFNSKGDFPPEEWNYFSFVFGIGQDTLSYCFRADLLGPFILTPIWLIIELLIRADFLDFEHLFKFFDLVDFLQWQRPRAAFAIGWWWARNASLTTIGLQGVQRWDDSYVDLNLNGFIGIAVTSVESTGFILGFSLRSRLTPN